MSVPFLDLAARHASVAEPVERRVLEVLRSGRYVGGPLVEEAEAVAAGLFGRRAAVGVASGTDALMLALQAVGVAPGDEVIVPALTFFATAGAVASLGAVPVVVDVGDDGLVDPEAVLAALSGRTAAVVPVHLFGSRATLPELPVPVVDDAAQAAGASPPVSTGVLTAVSAYPTKLWGAAGNAGFVVGDDPEALDRVRRLREHAMHGPHLHHRVGPWVGRNARLDALQAAVLLGQTEGLQGRLAARRALLARYEATLPVTVRPLPRTEGSPASPFVVRSARRDALVAALTAADIGCSVYYPRALGDQPALADQPRRPTPVADRLCRELLALPLHAAMSVGDVDRVVAVLEGA